MEHSKLKLLILKLILFSMCCKIYKQNIHLNSTKKDF